MIAEVGEGSEGGWLHSNECLIRPTNVNELAMRYKDANDTPPFVHTP